MSRKGDFIKVGDVIWRYLDSGTYNNVYFGEINGEKKVYKIPKARMSAEKDFSLAQTAMDTPVRAVRLWNEVNPKFPAEIYYDGWIAPFIKGQVPSAQEICNAIADLYQRTGRVLADGISPGNFIRIKTGEIICVDVGAALKLERIVEEEKSEASLKFWYEMRDQYNEYFLKHEQHKYAGPIGEMTRALLFLQQCRPDVKNVACLKSKAYLVTGLAHAYKNNQLPQDLYTVFPINLNYFSKNPLLHDILHAGNFSDYQKKKLCQLYQLKKFRYIHIQLTFLLCSLLKEDFSNAMRLIKSCNINQTVRLSLTLTDEYQFLELIRRYFKKQLSDAESTLVEEILEKTDSRGKNILRILNCLSQANLLTQARFDEVRAYKNLVPLYNAVNVLLEKNMLTESHFAQVSSHPSLISLSDALSAMSQARILTHIRYDEVVLHDNIESMASAVNALSQENMLTVDRFDEIKSNDRLSSSVSHLSLAGKLTKDSYAVLNSLSKLDMLTTDNINEVKSHANFHSLVSAVDKLSKEGDFTQETFNRKSLGIRVHQYISDICFQSDKIKAMASVTHGIDSVLHSNVTPEEKISKLHSFGKAIMRSCLKIERGGLGFFSVTGNTTSYQHAMDSVKSALLSELSKAKPGSISSQYIVLSREIIAEQTGRFSNPFNPSCLLKDDYKKHEIYYNKKIKSRIN